MAILETCSKCGATFSSNPSECKIWCNECDGTNAAKRKEAERWKNLPLEDKVEELKRRVDSLTSHSYWDGRF